VLGATLIGDDRVTADDDDPGGKMCGQRPSDTTKARAVPRPTTCGAPRSLALVGGWCVTVDVTT